MNDNEKLWKELGLNVELHAKFMESASQAYKKTIGSQKNRPFAMRYFDNALHEMHGGRVQELVDYKKAGGKVLGTFCIYVPDELALAAGVMPIALCGGNALSVPYAERVLPHDICPLIKSTMGMAFSKTCPYAPIKDMAVGETTCDAKKKTWEILAEKGVNIHIMELPQKKKELDKKLWLDEVREFKNKMEELSGKKITAELLKNSIRLLNNKRKALAELNSFRQLEFPPISGLDVLLVTQIALVDDPKRFVEKLDILNRELEERAKNGISPIQKGSKRIMVSGCPSVAGNWKLHHIIETSGAVVVCDESCTGTRYYEELVSEEASDLDGQLDALSKRYMGISCSCFTPNTERMEKVVKLAESYKVNGVVQYVLQFCHTYNVEAVRVENALKKTGVPSMKIETDYSEEDTGQLKTRIGAFIEMINE